MKLKWLLTGLAAAGLLVSSAVAAPPEGAGKPPPTGEGCKPKVTVVLKGTLDADPGDTLPAVLMVNVTRSNRHGRAYKAAVQPTSVNVDEDTKVRRRGAKTVGALEQGDRVLVQARVCKAELADDGMPPLTAVRVVAHPVPVEA